LRVESVSSALVFEGDRAAIIVVSAFPPRDSCSTRVSFEFL